MSELVLTCDRCRFPIVGDTGCLSASMTDIGLRQGGRYSRLGGPPGAAEALDRLIGQPLVRWRALHDACREPDEDDCYQIDAATLQTRSGLLSWTAHLMEKNWLADTDWRFVIREAIGGGEPARIAPSQNASAA